MRIAIKAPEHFGLKSSTQIAKTKTAINFYLVFFTYKSAILFETTELV